MSEAPGTEGGTEERPLNIVVKCKNISFEGSEKPSVRYYESYKNKPFSAKVAAVVVIVDGAQ